METGFTRAKKAGNIIMKNLMDFSVGTIAYAVIGFGLMFGVSKFGLFGTDGFFMSTLNPSTPQGLWQFAYWLFQAALARAIVLEPIIGKYTPDAKPKAIPGHNIPLAALGVFILWFGWFGFNPGSTTADTNLSIAVIAVTTNIAAAGGAISAMITVWIRFGKPDINGVLAGLVSVTAGCACVSPLSALIIGVFAGVLVVLAIEFIDKILKIDDPVGAISVYGVCGAFGTRCVGLFA